LFSTFQVIRCKAVLLRKPGTPLAFEEIEVALPKAKEIHIKLKKKKSTFPHLKPEWFTMRYVNFFRAFNSK
uniref:Uncharacterized protein n=1 Tax=Sciurus vulgaris TaxID=55149 RepID=A0A8D2B9L4_SCIVU